METNLVGIYFVLFHTDVWIASVLLFSFFNIIIFGGQHWSRGFGYNVSRSAQFGDNALIIAVLVACSILSKARLAPNVFNSVFSQLIILLVCLVIGGLLELIALLKSRQQETLIDMIHNIIIIPGFLFLLITMLPITLLIGNIWQKVITIFCLAIWFLLFLSDVKTNRLDQHAWFKANGFPSHFIGND